MALKVLTMIMEARDIKVLPNLNQVMAEPVQNLAKVAMEVKAVMVAKAVDLMAVIVAPEEMIMVVMEALLVVIE